MMTMTTMLHVAVVVVDDDGHEIEMLVSSVAVVHSYYDLTTSSFDSMDLVGYIDVVHFDVGHTCYYEMCLVVAVRHLGRHSENQVVYVHF